jgi:glycosyltransferase involved in cell wall biosynthesis
MYGAENVVLHLAKNPRGNSVQIFCLVDKRRPSLALFEECKREKVKAELLWSRKRIDLRTFLKLRLILKNNKYDILHCHGFKAGFYGLLAGKCTHTHLVETCHLWTRENRLIRFYEFVDALCLRRFDAVIAVSDEIRGDLIRYRVPKGKIKVIYNGIDLSKYERKESNRAMREFGVNGHQRVVGIVGRLQVEKGHVYFLEAAKEILKKRQDVLFLVIGDGPLREDLESLTNRLEISSHVKFLGYRKDVVEIYSGLDVLVSASLREGLPMTLLEAMAVGVPIVATSVGGVPRIIKNNETGMLIQAEDIENMSKSVLLLLNNKEKRDYMSANAKRLVEDHFSAQIMSERYTAIYKDILDQVGVE